MSEKRRDSKHRILRNGESQRKDGRYAFKFVDAFGQQQFVYSWRLEKTDPMPAGKRFDLSLREKEQIIQQEINSGITPNGGNMTVLQLVKKYVMQKTGVRHNTEAGYRRVLPMTDDVYACFQRIIENRNPPKVEPVIDGKAGFLFFDKNGMPMVAQHWEKYFQHICEKYNSIYKVQMPKVTPHVCRHTYCSNMAKSGMNPKTLQYLMGHSDIGVTLNTYTHMDFDDAKAEVIRVVNL